MLRLDRKPANSRTGKLSIKIAGPVQEASVEIRNTHGQLVYYRPLTTDLSIGTAGWLTPGIWILTVNNDGKRKSFKLVVL